jgi:hypothetical protein
MTRVVLAAVFLAAFSGTVSRAGAEPLVKATRGLFSRGRFVIGSLVVQRGGREQRLVMGHVIVTPGSAGAASLLAALDAEPDVLAASPRIRFEGFLKGGSGAEIRIAERQAAQGRRNSRISRQLGIRALSRRNWARAAEHFDRVLEAHPRFARIRQLSRFATCMADPSRTAAQACSLAREVGSEEPGS